ncbi:MAG: ectoine hydroxylase [Leptospirillia bacterium]
MTQTQMQCTDHYPTRGESERLIPRVDPVVYGGGEPVGAHSLTADQIARYEADGFILLPGVFTTDEVADMRAETERLKGDPALTGRDELVLEPDSDRARSIFSVHRFSPLFDSISRDPRVLDKVNQILGGDSYIHQSRINIKRPLNGKSFPWHSDFETWHAEDGMPRMRALSAWVMLTPNTEFNGPLYLVPGSHRQFVACKGYTPDNHHKQSLRKQAYGVPSLGALGALVNQGGIAGAYGEPGTLVLHESNIMHGSPDNITPEARTNVFFIYNSVDNVPAERPFAAPRFRPEFLGGRDFSPLTSTHHRAPDNQKS